MIKVKSNIKVEFKTSFLDNRAYVDLFARFTSSNGEHISSFFSKTIGLNFLDKLAGKTLQIKTEEKLKKFEKKVERQRQYLENGINAINEIRIK